MFFRRRRELGVSMKAEKKSGNMPGADVKIGRQTKRTILESSLLS
jgi:hypothetical protein